MHARVLALLTLAVALLGASRPGMQAAAAAGFEPRPSYTGDCAQPPVGASCLVFDDGYIWLVPDVATGWGENHGTVQIAYGRSADYAHALGTTGVWTLPK